MEEKDIILRLKNGDHDAFAWIYNKYWSQVYEFCRLYITSPEDAKEIIQQVFVKVWEARYLIKENENFKGFLFIITRNLIFNQSKKSFNENFYKLSVLNAFSTEQEGYDMEEEIVASQLKEFIDELINMLPPRQKEVFLLSRESHLSYKEISLRLCISEKTVEHHITKAMRFIKVNLKLFVLFSMCYSALETTTPLRHIITERNFSIFSFLCYRESLSAVRGGNASRLFAPDKFSCTKGFS